MARRILVRAGKHPFTVASARETLTTNLIGDNSGNLLFSTAACKLVSTPGTQVDTYGLDADPGDADRINERYDMFVIPLANAFRPDFRDRLRRFTELIVRLRIPVVVLGVGAQSTPGYHLDPLRPIDQPVTEFVRAALDRSASVGVRGEFTRAYLEWLGFTRVEVIGCPSMFLFGDRVAVAKGDLHTGSRIAVNAAARAPAMGDVLLSHHRRYPDLTYVPQGRADLDLLLRARERPPAGNAVRFFLDPWPWIRHLATRDFSFGNRIHGTIAALLAGTPACVLTHDSRTLELARYLEIPHAPLDRDRIDARDLHRQADFGALNRNHAARFAAYLGFAEANGLEHIYADPAAEQAFDDALAGTAYPPPVEAPLDPHVHQLVDRLRAPGGPAGRSPRGPAA